MAKVSGLIICKDEEKNIEECLKSIRWCDEIVIIDSFSTDNTIGIAKNYTDRIISEGMERICRTKEICPDEGSS